MSELAVEHAGPIARTSEALVRTPTSLRILTVMSCGRAERSGMPTANASISRALRDLGCVVDHLYVDDYAAPARVPRLRYLLFGPLTVERVRRLEEQHGCYDVVQISGGDGFMAPLLRRDRRGRRRLVVARSHGLEHLYWREFLRVARAGHVRSTLQHRIYFGTLRLKEVELSVRSADLLNCHTAGDARYVTDRRWKRPDEVLVAPGGIEPAWFGACGAPAERAERILFCGTWTWMKGTHVLVRVFERLALRDPHLRLTVVGAAANPADALAAFAPSLRDRVTVLPALPHTGVLDEFRRHDLLLSTSLFEGFGTAVVEAMAAGLPVVASAVGVAPDYIEHGRSGYLAQPGDIEAHVSACMSLLTSGRRTRRAMTVAAMDAVSVLTWPRVAEATATAYAAALACVAKQR